MRLSALVPAICCAGALVLTFLCMFAGHKKGFMEDYHLITLNTSAVGRALVDSQIANNPTISNFLDSIPSSLANTIDQRISDITRRLGIEDFYSMHVLDYCYGQYTPAESPNATLSLRDIHKTLTGCSKTEAMYKFDPTEIVEDALNRTTGRTITLQDLDWPDDIRTGTAALNAVMAAIFILYCVAIGLIFISLCATAWGMVASGRLSACINLMLALLALITVGLASAFVTVAAVKVVDKVNQDGSAIGLQASKGNKFLALTWVATGLMFIVVLTWIVEFCIGQRHRSRRAARDSKLG